MRTQTWKHWKHWYTFSILITFPLSCIELNMNFANLAITALPSFVMMNINFCSPEVNDSKCSLLFVNALYNTSLSLAYKSLHI